MNLIARCGLNRNPSGVVAPFQYAVIIRELALFGGFTQAASLTGKSQRIIQKTWHALKHQSFSGVCRNFSWRVSFSSMGLWWSFAFSVRCLWRHNLTSYSCFHTIVLAKFIDTGYRRTMHPMLWYSSS